MKEDYERLIHDQKEDALKQKTELHGIIDEKIGEIGRLKQELANTRADLTTHYNNAKQELDLTKEAM